MTRPTIDPYAPERIGGYRVVAATARPAGNVSNGDGSPVFYAGVARVVREDGKQAVVWYDQSHAQVYSGHLCAPLYSTGGVDYVARWVSPKTSREHYLNIVWEG
jgi:hypothetical protein